MKEIKSPDEIWNAACEAQMKEVYSNIPPSGDTNYHAIKHWTKKPVMPQEYASQFTHPSIPSDEHYTEWYDSFLKDGKTPTPYDTFKWMCDQIGCSVLNEEEIDRLIKKYFTDEKALSLKYSAEAYAQSGTMGGAFFLQLRAFAEALSLRSGECDKELPFDKVTRIEIINHNPNEKKHSMGRTFVSWRDDNYVYGNIQDNGKTLKIFIEEKSPHQTK